MDKLLEFEFIEIIEVFIRSIISFICLFLVTKLLGKKQVSQLSLFDYVVGISIGNFAAEISINIDNQYLNGIIGVLVFGIIAYIISKATMKSIKLRKFFTGVPTILIQNGEIIEKNLKKVRFDINDLLGEARLAGYFNIDEIEYAIMEANGRLSFLLKSENKNVTLKDMNIKATKEDLCANVIIDGNIIYESLNNMHKDESWLLKQIKEKGYELKEILLATLDINEKLNIYERNYNKKIHNVLE